MKDVISISEDVISKILKIYGLEQLLSLEENKVSLINSVFILNKKYVLRINLKDNDESKKKFEKEAYLYSHLDESGVPTPKCLAYDTSHAIIDHEYLILSYIPGETLTVAFENADFETKSRLSFGLGKIAHKIHSLGTAPSIARPDLFGTEDAWSQEKEREFNTYYDHIKSKDLLPKDLTDGIDQNILDYQSLGDLSGEYSLIHGDYSRDNLQVEGGQIVGIFDFEMAQIGDPLYDLQKLPINFQLGPRFDRNAFLAGYQMKTMSRSEKIRLSRYAISQGLWEIWATDTKQFLFDDKEIQEGKDLIINAL